MKRRIDWIDIVRAVGMFLIIMGHTLEVYTYSIVGKLIFAVHVLPDSSRKQMEIRNIHDDVVV